jgi:hypothetical protein
MMQKNILFRQWVNKSYWREWGFGEGADGVMFFAPPLSPTEQDDRPSFQFIGREKAGKKNGSCGEDIFEGDIREWYDGTTGKMFHGVIVYHRPDRRFFTKFYKEDGTFFYKSADVGRRIGNVCENPDLLKGGNNNG